MNTTCLCVHKSQRFHLYFLTTAVTTRATLSSFFGLIGSYFGFAGMRATSSSLFLKYFMVHAPSTSAMTISPLFGVRPLSTRTMSPGRMPAPDMESPETFSRKVVSGFCMRRSSRERVSATDSSAGLGNPASTVPSILTVDAMEPGMSLPFVSRSRTFNFSSLLMSLKTAFFDRRPAISPISEKLGILPCR